jgi:hypothetical protein
MAIARINGGMLQNTLERNGVNIQIDSALYVNVTDNRIGVNNTSPAYTLDITGNAHLGNLYILGNTITAESGKKVNLGNIGNLVVAGGNNFDVVYTDGAGNLQFANLNALSALENFVGNNIQLGSNTAGYLVSNAVALTTTTSVTDAVSQLNYVLGKLVPPSPPSFPNNTTLTVNSITSYGRMTTVSQVDNTGSGRSVSAATTLANVLRTGSYTTNTFSNMGEGSSGTLTVYLDGRAAGANTLVGGGGAKTTSNLVITNNQDYHNVSSSVSAGFWYSFSVYATGTVYSGGYHGVNIAYTGGSGTSTSTATWYWDASSPGAVTFSNITGVSGNIVLTTNSVSYSSTIPHLNSSSVWRLKGNVAKLSGDLYYSSDTFITGSSATGFQSPASVTYSSAGVTTPLAPNLYVSSGSAYFETTSSVATGFGSATTGPTVTGQNSYTAGTSPAFTPGGTILYKTNTTTNIEETSIPVSTGTGSGNAYRILNPGSGDTPTYTGSETAFNSQTSTLQTYDATNVGSGSQGVIKFDQTNYSVGYTPIGPNLSGQAASQYFTFKFVRTSVSKFDIAFTGTIAGLWVALPGSTLDSTSTLNGWLTLATAFAGGATKPGANTGAGGNGSNGCALGGVATLNSAGSQSITATFGIESSSNATSNEIYVRIKLTSGQSLTALSIVGPTH